MKKILVTITLAAICLAANAQPNQKFVELENYLNELGHGFKPFIVNATKEKE